MYKRGNKFGGDKKFGGNKFGKRSFGGDRGFRDGGRPQMHKAVCDECGRPCEVPFKPTGDRPVYCNNCFKKSEGGGPRNAGRDSGKSYGASHSGNSGDFQKQFDILNKKLDQILKALTDIGEEGEGDDGYDDNEDGEEA